MTCRKTQSHSTLLRAGISSVLILFALILPDSASACSCLGNGLPVRGLEKYNAVFLGTVTESGEEEFEDPRVDERRKRAPEIPPMKMKRLRGVLTVEKMWKGEPRKTINYVSTVACPAFLTQGEKYLLYVSLENEPLVLSMCSPVQMAKNKEVEMMFLDWTFAGLSTDEIIDRLVQMLLRHENEEFRFQSVSLLANPGLRISPQVKEPEIWDALREAESSTRSQKIRAAFWKAMKDPSGRVRGRVVENIYQTQLQPDALKEFLTRSLKDSSIKVRLASFYLFKYFQVGKLGEIRGEWVGILKKNLREAEQQLAIKDRDEKVIYHREVQKIIRWLIRLEGKKDNGNFMPLILEGLRHEDYWVRSSAAFNLWVIKREGRNDLGELKAFIEKNLDEEARKKVEEHIEIIKGARGIK